MAKNVELMGAVFPDCPAVMLPTHEGPLARFTDVSDSQAVAADVAQGKQFYLADGTKATGTNQGGGGGGGGGGTIKPNARLVLIDYDGSIVDSYTQSEINALSALPANPDHSGDEIPLTSQGWNWTLTEIREQLTAMPEQVVYVGNTVIPTDGKTHILIYIDPVTPTNNRSMGLVFSQSKANGVTVDWGDESTPETYSGAGTKSNEHLYAEPGWYDITLTATNGTVLLTGSSGSNGNSIFGPRSNARSYRRTMVREVYVGTGLKTSGYQIDSYVFNSCYSLKTITLPDTVKSVGTYLFQDCYSLTSVIIPRSMDISSGNMFYTAYNLNTISMPPTVELIGTSVFYNCYNLEHVTIPKDCFLNNNYAFYNCYKLKKLFIPQSTTILGTNAFYGARAATSVTIYGDLTSVGSSSFATCYGLTSITFPASVTSIASGAFSNCYSIKEYHLKPTTPPTLAGAINGMATDCVIYVPYSEDHSVLAAYQAASNWSTYASRMVEEAE